MSLLVTALARTVRPSGDTIDPASVEFKLERRGFSTTVLIDVREARELARVMTAAAGAAEALEPVVCMVEVVAQQSGGAQAQSDADQPEDGGAR